MKTTDAKLIFVHSTCLAIAEAAARTVGLLLDRIVLVDKFPNGKSSYTTVHKLVTKGLNIPRSYTERKLKPGEGKTKIAFLNFSSGTTGLPKVRCIWRWAVSDD